MQAFTAALVAVAVVVGCTSGEPVSSSPNSSDPVSFDPVAAGPPTGDDVDEPDGSTHEVPTSPEEPVELDGEPNEANVPEEQQLQDTLVDADDDLPPEP